MTIEDATKQQGLVALYTAMEARRKYLKLTLAEIARRGGPERTTWRRIEKGQQYPQSDTLTATDKVLGWPEGIAKAVLELRRPIPAPDEWIKLTEARRHGMLREHLVRLQKEQERGAKSQAAQRKLVDDLLNIIDQR